MRRFVVSTALVLIVLLFAVTPLLQMLPARGYVPLAQATVTGGGVALPVNSIVLNVGEQAKLTRPFEVHPDASAACGKVVVLPEGRATKDQAGTAVLELNCTNAATHHAWARVRWNDSCGNSLSVKLGDGPARKVGQDATYRHWHWVRAGELELTRGTHRLELGEREDGVAIDQVLLAPDPEFVPSGSYGGGKADADIRRFADDFARSPGHGLGGWNVLSGTWDINFDLDPNRIPNQYTLGIENAESNTAAVVLVDGPPWKGCRFAASFTTVKPGRFGVAISDAGNPGGDGDLRVVVTADDKGVGLCVTAAGGLSETVCAPGDVARLGQWHRLVVERWAWLLRVSLDGQVVYTTTELHARPVLPGLFMKSGVAAFDDVDVVEIPWAAEDGGDFRMSWGLSDDAKWYRRKSDSRKPSLLGKEGAIAVAKGPHPFYALFLDEEEGSRSSVDAPAGLEEALVGGGRLFSGLSASPLSQDGAIRVSPGKGPSRIRRLAVSFGGVSETAYCEGPYHFTSSRIEDPADYLDFTDEELKVIRESPDVEKLRRGHRWRPLVGPAISESIWRPEGGKWGVRQGCLRGDGPGAVRFWRDYLCDVDLHMKVRMCTDDARVDIVLFEGLGSSLVVSLGGEPPEGPAGDSGLHLAAPKPGEWHRFHVRYRAGLFSARINDAEWIPQGMERGPGGGVLLAVPAGRVEFDDIELSAPHSTKSGRFYAFDHVETDWWREGADWIDHGGINCVLASSWISLIAPKGRGMLWNKAHFGSDVLVHLTLNANSVWYGWNKNPTHEHYPYDNICAVLSSSQDVDSGYRLEVNSRKRTATVLYRDGKEVAAVKQGEGFPMRYVGGHFPFRPRVGTVALWKRGAKLVGIVNGQKVLEYSDPDPLDIKRVGLGGYDTRTNFALIQIRGNVQ